MPYETQIVKYYPTTYQTRIMCNFNLCKCLGMQKLTEVELKLIQNKIGHPVEEIRRRAINSLLYKLKHELVDPASLVNEDKLFGSLLSNLEFCLDSSHKVCQFKVVVFSRLVTALITLEL